MTTSTQPYILVSTNYYNSPFNESVFMERLVQDGPVRRVWKEEQEEEILGLLERLIAMSCTALSC